MHRLPTTFIMACVLALAGMIAPDVAAARGFAVFHDFQGPGSGDGWFPTGALLRDDAGSLYGTTNSGGTINRGCRIGCGTVYKITPDGTETILHAFDGSDGDHPAGGVVMDKEGNLYGATSVGGSPDHPVGTVFKLQPDGTVTVLYNFGQKNEYADGSVPRGGLTLYKGDLYGTTEAGGGICASPGCGVVFKLARDGTETVLYSFAGGSDGDGPEGNLTMDTAGNIYGTTYYGGGSTRCYDGCGVVFKLAPDGTETVLHAFSGGSDGNAPLFGVTMDSANNLYGTTEFGGQITAKCTDGCGVVFKLAPDGTETVLYDFGGGSDGAYPDALLLTKAGDLYGTTERAKGCCGTAYKLAPDGTETVLHSFAAADGRYPSSLVAGKNGTIYGTAITGGDGTGCKGSGGGKGCGTVFVLSK